MTESSACGAETKREEHDDRDVPICDRMKIATVYNFMCCFIASFIILCDKMVTTYHCMCRFIIFNY